MIDFENNEMFDPINLSSTEEILIYMSWFMPSGNFETENLPEKLQKKSLTHQEFNELCENILNFLEYGPWPEWEDISILEQVLVMTAEQAISLMPLSIFEYDALNEFDKWAGNVWRR